MVCVEFRTTNSLVFKKNSKNLINNINSFEEKNYSLDHDYWLDDYNTTCKYNYHILILNCKIYIEKVKYKMLHNIAFHLNDN